MKTYKCTDGNAEIEIEAESAQAAAQEYVDTGDWCECDSTCWIDVCVWEKDDDEDDGEWYSITVDPPEPECIDDDDHDWQSPYEIVGGIKENPGVWGHGGGVIIVACCMHCGARRTIDTWAQNPSNGAQGYESIQYDGPGYFDLDNTSYED